MGGELEEIEWRTFSPFQFYERVNLYVNKILNSEKQPSKYDEKICKKLYDVLSTSLHFQKSIRHIVYPVVFLPKLKKYLKRYDNPNLPVHKGGNYVYVKNYGKRCVRLSNKGKKYIIIDGKRKYLYNNS